MGLGLHSGVGWRTAARSLLGVKQGTRNANGVLAWSSCLYVTTEPKQNI